MASRGREVRPEGRAGAAVREVCLLGVDRAAPGWAEGDQLVWGGRRYRVAATHGEGGARYLHLAPAGEVSPPCPT